MSFLEKIFFRKEETNSSKLALDGEVYRIRGQYKKALSNFNKAIEIEPDNDMFYASRSSVKRMLNDVNGALVDIEKAISLKPTVNAYKKVRLDLQKTK